MTIDLRLQRLEKLLTPLDAPARTQHAAAQRQAVLDRAYYFFESFGPDRQRVEDQMFLDENGAWHGDPAGPHTGLLAWLLSIMAGDSDVPERLPAAVSAAYLDDSTAMPHSRCEPCRLLLPVRPDGPGIERVTYFPVCPVCGGLVTGGCHV